MFDPAVANDLDLKSVHSQHSLSFSYRLDHDSE